MENYKSVEQLAEIIGNSCTAHELDYLLCRITGVIGNIKFTEFEKAKFNSVLVMDRLLVHNNDTVTK